MKPTHIDLISNVFPCLYLFARGPAELSYTLSITSVLHLPFRYACNNSSAKHSYTPTKQATDTNYQHVCSWTSSQGCQEPLLYWLHRRYSVRMLYPIPTVRLWYRCHWLVCARCRPGQKTRWQPGLTMGSFSLFPSRDTVSYSNSLVDLCNRRWHTICYFWTCLHSDPLRRPTTSISSNFYPSTMLRLRQRLSHPLAHAVRHLRKAIHCRWRWQGQEPQAHEALRLRGLGQLVLLGHHLCLVRYSLVERKQGRLCPEGGEGLWWAYRAGLIVLSTNLPVSEEDFLPTFVWGCAGSPLYGWHGVFILSSPRTVMSLLFLLSSRYFHSFSFICFFQHLIGAPGVCLCVYMA